MLGLRTSGCWKKTKFFSNIRCALRGITTTAMGGKLFAIMAANRSEPSQALAIVTHFMCYNFCDLGNRGTHKNHMAEKHGIDMDAPLLAFSPTDLWTINDATQGTSIMGATGSGKTSGSGATIAKAFLSAGFGGLVLCAKPEERRLWERYARETGRLKNLIVFSPTGYTFDANGQREEKQWRFNFLDYELRRVGRGGGLTENIVNLITRVTELAEGTHDIAGKEQFWERAMRQLIRNAIEILSLGQGRLTLKDMAKLVREAPLSQEQLEKDAKWWDESFCAKCILEAEKKEKTPREQNDFEMAWDYWLREYPNMGDRTRSSIVATFTSVADQLLHGLAWELLCTETNIIPELTYKNGAIIVLDLPIQEFQELGRITQGIFKFMFQRAILRRDPVTDPYPVFLWADEAQNFVSSFDYQYQAVARSARACTVYMTQNISNYYAVLGGANSHDEANALLGNFQTKIFHANGDHATNQFAADMIGQDWMTAFNYGVSQGSQDPSRSGGGSETVQYKVLPHLFTRLRKGGKENDLQVEGIIFQGGRIWNGTNDTHITRVFNQE
jgi:TraM recognition site of TraD and TraG